MIKNVQYQFINDVAVSSNKLQFERTDPDNQLG